MQIQEIFQYFARFASLQGVLDNFEQGSSSRSGYASLQQSLESIDYLNIVPHYIFSTELDKVKMRVSKILDEPYLFVDYGEYSHRQTQPGQYADSLELALTVATPMREITSDTMEQLIAMDDCLDRITRIRHSIIADRCKADPITRGLMQASRLVPFSAPELASIGWTLLFHREGYDSSKLKPKQP